MKGDMKVLHGGASDAAVAASGGDDDIIEMPRGELQQLAQRATADIALLERQVQQARQAVNSLQLQRAQAIGRLEVLQRLLGAPVEADAS